MAVASLKVFSELLKNHPDGKDYLISYLYKFQNYNGDGKLDPLNRADRMLREYKNELIKNGVQSSRIINSKAIIEKTLVR